MKTTRVTSSIASNRVITTSSTDALMKGVVSNGMNQETPCGKFFASWFMRATMAALTLSALAPGRRNTRTAAVVTPLTLLTRS
jgi:hypothetical protein